MGPPTDSGQPISLPRQLVRTRRFTLGVPSDLTVTAEGKSVLFLRGRSGNDLLTCLWALDLDTGSERRLADPADLLTAGDERAGIAAYATDDAGGLAAFALCGSLYVVEVPTGRMRRLPAVGQVTDPRPDPTGRRIAYVAAGALRVIEADGSADRAIAEPDGPDVRFGVAEHVATESIGKPRGFWWAPDGERLLVARVDESAVGIWYVSDPAEPTRPPRAVRYPAAGTANAEVTLWISTIDGDHTEVPWDRAGFEYLVAAGWDAHGPIAAVQTRDQGTVRVLAVDPDDGGTRILATQQDPAWVTLVRGLPARTGRGALVAHRDTDGTRQLTLDGVPVTPAGLQLREVLGVDGDEVLFTASTEPTEVHLWTYGAGTGLAQLSAQSGVHTGVRRAGTLVHLARTPGRPGTKVAVLREGRPAVAVGSLAQHPVLPLHSIMITTTARELRSQLLLPSWHRPGDATLPVLLDPYAGAAMQRVLADQAPLSFVAQWFAEQGFAVLVTDGSGTPGRGPDWEREVHGDLLGSVLDDQVAALHETARRHPELDLTRVGIRGWSFGGTLAVAAVLRRPDVFHAAVAGAGVTDGHLYDTHWRERFLGHPDRYPERYAAGSLVLEAPKLTRPLLLVHGLADDNVFPANTLRLSSALVAAGRPHEVLLLPGTNHRPADESVFEHLLLHQVAFLRRHLSAPVRASCARRSYGRPD